MTPSTNRQLQCSPQAVQAVLDKFGDQFQFGERFNPSLQNTYARKYHDRCFVGTAPSLLLVSDAYGENVCKGWLMLQIKDINLAAGGSDPTKKMTTYQIEDTAETIMTNYPALKVTEFMLFCSQFKGGKYGKFYGAVDSMVITEALSKFMEYRLQEIQRIQREMAKAKSEAEREARKHEKTMSLDEYLEQNKDALTPEQIQFFKTYGTSD